MQLEENKQVIDDLIISYLKGELNDEQRNELITWIKQDQANKRYFDELSEIWITSRSLEENTRYDFQKGFQYFREQVGPEGILKGRWLNYKNILRIAAVFLLAFSVGGLIFFQIGKRQGTLNGQNAYEIIVPRGAKAHFVMADGTVVTLNAGSKLHYLANFGVNNRNVQLEGEGYFKVAKDKSKPFIVSTTHVNIKALGTEFNVKAYPSEKTIETTLVEGSVRVENINSGSKLEAVVLKPNQKLTFYKDDASFNERDIIKSRKDISVQVLKSQKLVAIHRLVAEEVNVNPVISWKENRWIIERLALSKLAVELGRKFDIRIQIESERLKKFRFTGTLEDESLEQVLNVMSFTVPINYKIKGKNVVFTEKEGFDALYKKLNDENIQDINNN